MKILFLFLTYALGSIAQDQIRLSPYYTPEEKLLDIKSPVLEEEIDQEESFLRSWDGRLRLGLGGAMSGADQKDTFSIEARPSLELSYGQALRAYLELQIFNDTNDSSTDPKKLSLWYIARGGLDGFPIRLRAKEHDRDVEVFAGMISRAVVRENTPSSEEHSYLITIGPALKFVSGKFMLLFSVGGYFYSLELDDDHPKKRGKERGELFLNSSGVAFNIEAFFQKCGVDVGASLHCLIDSRGYFREVSAQGFAETSLLPEQALPIDLRLRIYFEGRYFDLNEISNALAFDSDFRAGAQIVVDFFPRKNESVLWPSNR